MIELTVASCYVRRTIKFHNCVYVVKRRVHFNLDRETVLFIVKKRWYHSVWFWALGHIQVCRKGRRPKGNQAACKKCKE